MFSNDPSRRPSLQVHGLSSRPNDPRRPSLQVSGLPGFTSDSPVSASSPAVERKNSILGVLAKARPSAYPLQHEWEFWHERYGQSNTATSPTPKKDEKPPVYEDTLVSMMPEINTIQKFWEVHNNFDVAILRLRDTVHLFKRTVKPVWEDPRNVRGGSWTFRMNKGVSVEVWKRVQLMAVGEVLQDVVEKGDDICGVSLSVRFNSHLISIWNRDAANQKSIDAIKECVLSELPETLRPATSNIYYKKHSEHKGFSEAVAATKAETALPSIFSPAVEKKEDSTKIERLVPVPGTETPPPSG